MSHTDEAINILKANTLQTDQGYQDAISALHEAGLRGTQLEGWLGVQNLVKSLEQHYGEDASVIANELGWGIFKGFAEARSPSTMIDSIVKACGKATPITIPSGKAIPITVPTTKAIEGQQPVSAPISTKEKQYQPPVGTGSLPLEGKRATGSVQQKMTQLKSVRLNPDNGTSLKKDFEHMAGEYKKMGAPSGGPPPAPSSGIMTSVRATPPKTPGAPSSATKEALSSIGVGKPGSTPESKEAIASITKKKAISKAIELLMGFAMAKAKSADEVPGNPANENWGTGGTVSGGNKAELQGPVSGYDYPGNEANRQESAGHSCPGNHANKQGPVSGPAHGGIGPAQTSVSGMANPANESQFNKALTSMSLPKLPMVQQGMDLRIWDSATKVLTAGNGAHAQNPNVLKHYGTGPLTGEVIQQTMQDSDERARRHIYNATAGPVFKSCGGCGRTYTLRKGMDGEELGCPTCSITKSSQCQHCGTYMAKSHGGHAACPLCG